MDAHTPKLLPGLSAYRWRRIIFWGWVAAVGLPVIAGGIWLIRWALGLPHTPDLFIVLGPAIALVLLLRLVDVGGTSPREKAEIELGYTTLPTVHPNLVHLHPTTGAVLREAGTTPLSAAELRALLKAQATPSATPIRGTSGVLMPPLEAMTDKKGRPKASASAPAPAPAAAPAQRPTGVAFPPTSGLASMAPPVLVVVGILVAGAFGLTARGGVSLLWVGLAVLAIVPLILLPIWLSMRARRARVTVLRPAAAIYDGLLTSDLRQASHRLGQGPMGGYWMTVALTDEGLEFWARDRQAPELTVRWQDVVAAEPGEVAYSNSVQPAVIVETETDIGRTLVPVSITSEYFVGKPSGDRLNELLFAIRDRISQHGA